MNPIRRIRQQYSHLRREDRKYRRPAVFDDEGREVVTLKLDSLKDAFSKFSPVGDRRINPEVKEYLTGQNRGLGPLVINVRNPDVADREGMREAFRKTVKEEFQFDCHRISRKITFNWVKSSVLTLFGLIILLFSILSVHIFPKFTGDNIILRTMDILAWVVLWEAFDGFLFTRMSLRFEYLKAARLRLAEFTFTE